MKKGMLFVFLAVVAAGCCMYKCSEPAKISVFSGTVHRVAQAKGISLSESAVLLKQAGVTGIETSYKDRKIAELMQIGLKPVNLYGFPKFLVADGGAKDSDEFIAVALKYNVPQIMVIPDNFSKDGDQEADFARICEGLGQLVAKASAVGVIVTIENFGGTNNPCSYAKYLKRFLTDIPELCFTLDSGNLYFAGRGEDIVEMADFAQGRISHVHLKDQTVENNRKYVTLGTGAVPNETVVKRVRKAGYRGWFTLENLVGDDILDDVHRQISVIRSWHK